MKYNQLGGVNDEDKAALNRAKLSDLVTLPKSVKGTNCYNCKWISEHKSSNHAFCKNSSVRQQVNDRMCCALWDSIGTYRPYVQEDKFK